MGPIYRSPAAWTPASSTLLKMMQEARWMFDFLTAQSAPLEDTAQASLSRLSPLPIVSVFGVVHLQTTRSTAIHITTKLAVLLLFLVHMTSVE